MGHEYFKNRTSFGIIPQLKSVVQVFSLLKNLTFDIATDLTANFTQQLGTGASQTVTSGAIQFRNTNYDMANGMTSNFTINKILSLLFRYNWWRGGSASQESFNYDVKILNASNAIVTTFSLCSSYTHTYNDGGPHYYNAGYIFWFLGTDANSVTTKRLCAVPSMGAYHTSELIDVGGGYIQFKLDGLAQGPTMYLGDPTYKLGGPVQCSPLGGWYNNNIYCDIDTFTLSYL